MARQRLSVEDRHVALLACAAFLIEDVGLSAHNAASLLNPAAIGTKRQSLERRFAGPERRAARIAAIAAGRALALVPADDAENGLLAPRYPENHSLAPEHLEAVNHSEIQSLAVNLAESAAGAVPAEIVAEWRAEAARQRSEFRATTDAHAHDRVAVDEDGGASDPSAAERVDEQNLGYDPENDAAPASGELEAASNEEDESAAESRKRQR